MAKQGRGGPGSAGTTGISSAAEMVSSGSRRGPSAGFTLVGAKSAPTVVSSPRVLPYRPHQGVHVVVRDPRAGGAMPALDRGSDDVLSRPGVAGCWTFQATNFESITYAEPAPAGRVVHVYWLEGSPSALASAMSNHGPDEVEGYATVFSGTYKVIEPDATYDWFDS